MKVVFRADASLSIGTGHVMRCITLANALTLHGVESEFICRAHEGHLIETVRAQGYRVHTLPMEAGARVHDATGSDYSHWLGVTQAEDLLACLPIMADVRPDWLVVDHYGLDARWEAAMAPYCGALMVVDDLADRKHACQLLLDQTFARPSYAYNDKVPSGCTLLCGALYALLRPRFSALRDQSLKRRDAPVLRELLVSMGGIDQTNFTCDVLTALRSTVLPAECRITVVMGPTAPWLEAVRAHASTMSWSTRVLVAVSDMAQLMCDSDLAIGAAGATSWERCCMGLPAAVVVMADNQRYAAHLLEQAKAIRLLESGPLLHQDIARFIEEMAYDPMQLAKLSQATRRITDGRGCDRVVAKLVNQEIRWHKGPLRR
jgi:UDP-2,4-diacetamido-2,4,6-trideoxy-beta-L-altropyranose hydrolase